MQDIPDLKYKLVLFVGSEAIELERKDDHTWAPVQRLYVLCHLTAYTHRSLCIQIYLPNIPDAFRGSNEERSSSMGEEGPEHQRDRPGKAL